ASHTRSSARCCRASSPRSRASASRPRSPRSTDPIRSNPKRRRLLMNAQTKTKTAQPNVVNGINVDDVFALIDSVKRDAAKGKPRWRVTTGWQGQPRSRSQVDGFDIGGQRVSRQFTIDIDEPNELGGSNRFANPQEHLLASLNACMTVGYVAQC